MLVNRRTFIPKRGHFDEAAALLKQAGEKSNFSGAVRFYTPRFGPFDCLAIEMEFEDWDQYHSFWANWSPGDAFWEKWYAITDNGGTNEVWQLI